MIYGMSSAVIHGGPFATLDVDIWINFPERQYMRVMNICDQLGGDRVSQCLACAEGVMVNFLCTVHGLKAFRTEYKNADWLTWQGEEVAVLPLDRLIASKEFVARDKDLAILPTLKKFLASKKAVDDEEN